MAKRINSINIVRMPKAAHKMFISDIVERAQADEKVSTACADSVADLLRAYREENNLLVVSTKSFHTDQIIADDQERGVLFMALKKAVGNYLNVPLPELAEPAKVLNQKIKDVGIDPRMQLDAETGLLFSFTRELLENYAEEVEALSLTKILLALKAANERVAKSTKSRYEERMKRSRKGAAQAARRTTDDAYRRLVKMVNARAYIEGDAEYAPFIDYVNVLIKRFKEEVLGRSSAASAGEVGEEQP